jgi:hypothetical protein
VENGARASEVTTDERACVDQRATPRFQMRIPELPSMDHMRPNLEGHRHVGGPRCGRKANGVVEQRFGRSYLDQRWREAS